jgi:uncharacterized membrane protein
MENHKLGTSNREISTTNGSANQTRVERTQDRWSFILILLGMLCLGVGFAQVDDDAARPVKNLEEADGQIHWPDEMTPKNADAFVHNQIFIKAPASVIWSNLVKAKDWPKWYSNSSDVKITDGSELGPKTQFTWTTLNFPIASRIDELVPNERISWYGDGPGHPCLSYVAHRLEGGRLRGNHGGNAGRSLCNQVQPCPAKGDV